VNGTENPDIIQLYAYGLYLSNGGTKDNFDELTWDDYEIMLIVHEASQVKLLKRYMELTAPKQEMNVM